MLEAAEVAIGLAAGSLATIRNFSEGGNSAAEVVPDRLPAGNSCTVGSSPVWSRCWVDVPGFYLSDKCCQKKTTASYLWLIIEPWVLLQSTLFLLYLLLLVSCYYGLAYRHWVCLLLLISVTSHLVIWEGTNWVPNVRTSLNTMEHGQKY